jgi:signal transduction histidine kinase
MLRTDAQSPPVVVSPSANLKVKALPFDLDNAVKTHVDGLLTRVSGVVRRITTPVANTAMTSVEISFPNGAATVILPWIAPTQVRNQWLNNLVVCDGVLVCPAPASLALKDTDALVLVPNRDSWNVRPNVLDAVFARPPVEDLGAIVAAQRLDLRFTARRLHLSGVVTAASPKEWVCLRMSGRSVQIMSEQAGLALLEPGTRVSVACCPQMRRGRLVLLDGVFRRTGGALEPVPPVALRGDAAEAGGLPMELVQVTGTLRNDPDGRGLPFLSLTTAGGTRFLVQWDTFLTREKSRSLLSGSEIMLTGIVKPLYAKAPSDDAAAFAIIPRSAQDVRVLRDPSWWTRTRLAVAAGWLAVVSALGIVTTLVSRSQIRRQRKAIREAETRAIAMEERNRIARELHDSFQQQLAGVALHLETMHGAVATVPHVLPQLLDETVAMVRHCQIEARHCIWDLRSTAPDGQDLPGALAAWLRMKSSEIEGIGLGFIQEGKIPLLGKDKAFQVLRIVQEAVNNAVAHAGAKQITVCLKGGHDSVFVSVADDGCGFDVDAALLRRQGRFGLRSLRERSDRIQGGLQFDSQSQHGTRVTLRVAADPSPS